MANVIAPVVDAFIRNAQLMERVSLAVLTDGMERNATALVSWNAQNVPLMTRAHLV